jgi:hypothetical protein
MFRRISEMSYRVAPVRSPDGGWVLNPDATLPLTILGADEHAVLELRSLLDPTDTVHATGLYSSVAGLVARSGLRCKEIEDYVARFRDTIAAGKEPDIVPYCDDPYALFCEWPVDRAAGRSLVEKYGFENLRFYSRHSKMIAAPRPIPPTHRDRKRFEELARVGLATIGPTVVKAGKSGEAFSLNVLKGSVGSDALAEWIRLCTVVAEVLTLTYSHSPPVAAIAQYETDPAIAEILKGYKVVTAGDESTCRFCARMDGKKYAVGSRPKLPFHIGCRCTVVELFR